MTPTDKMELQVSEYEDGSAIVELPHGQDNPQDNIDLESSPSEFRTDDDDGDYVDPDREKIREARREERKLKKQIHREKARESNYLITALRKQNQEMAERLAKLEQKTSGAELARVDKAIEDADVEVEYAKMRMQEAVGVSDGQALTRAQEQWFEAKRKKEALENVKIQATRQMSNPNQNTNLPDPLVQKMAAQWMEDNPWFDPRLGNEESQIAQMLDKKLTEEGYDPTSAEYWETLDERIKKYIPQVQNRGYNESSVHKSRPRSVVTSSGREATASARAGEYIISPDRVAAMKEAGVWDNPQAKKRMVAKFMEWDRQNKVRN